MASKRKLKDDVEAPAKPSCFADELRQLSEAPREWESMKIGEVKKELRIIARCCQNDSERLTGHLSDEVVRALKREGVEVELKTCDPHCKCMSSRTTIVRWAKK